MNTPERERAGASQFCMNVLSPCYVLYDKDSVSVQTARSRFLFPLEVTGTCNPHSFLVSHPRLHNILSVSRVPHGKHCPMAATSQQGPSRRSKLRLLGPKGTDMSCRKTVDTAIRVITLLV